MSVFYTLNARATACLTKLGLRGGWYRTPLAPPRPASTVLQIFLPARPPPACRNAAAFCSLFPHPLPTRSAPFAALTVLRCQRARRRAGEAASPPGGARAAWGLHSGREEAVTACGVEPECRCCHVLTTAPLLPLRVLAACVG